MVWRWRIESYHVWWTLKIVFFSILFIFRCFRVSLRFRWSMMCTQICVKCVLKNLGLHVIKRLLTTGQTYLVKSRVLVGCTRWQLICGKVLRKSSHLNDKFRPPQCLIEYAHHLSYGKTEINTLDIQQTFQQQGQMSRSQVWQDGIYFNVVFGL